MTSTRVRMLKLGIGLTVSIGCILYLFSRIDIDALWQALVQFRWPLLIFAMTSLVVDYALRIVRWSLMLRFAGADVSARACVPAFLGSMALNNVLPLRAGDVVRALVFPASLGVKRMTATASLVLERLLDLMTLMVLLAIGLACTPAMQISPSQKEGLIAVAVVGALFLTTLVALSGKVAVFVGNRSTSAAQNGYLRSSQMLAHAQGLIGSFSAMSGARALVSLAVLSILVWLANSGLYLAVMHGFSITASSSMAITVMAIATLSTLIPSSPGYAGPFHLAAYAAVAMLGGDSTQAAGFALVSHLALWLPVTITGFIAIAMTPEMFRKSNLSDAEFK